MTLLTSMLYCAAAPAIGLFTIVAAGWTALMSPRRVAAPAYPQRPRSRP